jgi:hypothetical protein
MQRQRSAILITCLLMVLFGGCTLFQTAFSDDRELIIIQPIKRLGSYQNVEFKSFTSDIDKIYAGLVRDINNNISKRLREGGFITFTGKTLLITGKVMQIEEGFSQSDILVRVELKDKSSGNSLGIANVKGKVEAERGLKAAAAEVAINVVNLLTKYGFKKIG